MENIREYLKNNVLLFDGAMGTYYDELTDDGIGCELANIKNSELIRGIHKEFPSLAKCSSSSPTAR